MPADVVSVLDAEHDQLRELFKRVASPGEDRWKVLYVLMQTLTSHSEMEKHILAPILKDRVADGEAMAERIDGEHRRIEHLLTLLERRRPNAPAVPGIVTELLDLNESHIADAQAAILPGLQAALSDEELLELGRRITANQNHQVARAHPIAPGNGPVASIGHKVAEMIDGVRTRTARRGASNP